MKTLFMAIIILTTASALASECHEISPKKARQVLEDGNFSSSSDLSALADNSDPDTLRDALKLGLRVQAAGNESMIYDVDALVYIVNGVKDSSDQLQKDLYSLTIDVLAQSNPSIPNVEYGDIFQTLSTIRVAARLALLGYEEDAQKLTGYMRRSVNRSITAGQWSDFAHILFDIRIQFTNGGEPVTPPSLLKALSLIEALPG